MRAQHLPTGRLDVACLADGPADGAPVLLLHGFPDDATAWVPMMERLAAAGRRCVAPFVRGCGGTGFRSDDTPRAGDFAALGNDALALVDALDLWDLTVVGQDWGSPTAEIVAMCRPERVRRLVKCNWYGVYSMHEMARAPGFGYAQLRTLWYVWLLNTPVGETILGSDRAGFVRALWEEWSPTWSVDARASALEAVLPSFAGEDWARVALSAYRSGTVPTETDPADEALRAMLQNPSPVRCPTRVVRGVDDGVERSSLAADARARWFPGGLAVTELAGVGHWPQREAPDAVVDAVLA